MSAGERYKHPLDVEAENWAQRVVTLEGLLREAGLLITHAGELHRPASLGGGGGTTDTELLVSGEYLDRRKAWLERAVKELGPEWVERVEKREEVNGK